MAVPRTLTAKDSVQVIEVRPATGPNSSDASIGDQDVELWERGEDRCDRIEVSDVHHRCSGAATASNLFDGCVEGGEIARGTHHMITVCGQALCACLANAVTGTSNKGYWKHGMIQA